MTEPGLATSSALSCDFSHERLPSGAFFSLRCLIYKVHAVLGGTLLILAHRLSLVKNFFQVLFGSFDVFNAVQQLFHVITSDSVCQELFSFFSNFAVPSGLSLTRSVRQLA